MRCIFIALFLCLLAPFTTAQDRTNTILVLDGSGSMWGQIDGVNKIVIAREVVSTLLDDFPTDQNLGLTVYGHRTRGDCTDIETVVPPGTGTLPAIRDAVNDINPRGRTPMTDAIINAAEALRFTENAATVILVSDGIETCNPDPCAAAAALESAGIDFTAHVVGFDVTDPEALAQMQCIAANTGGEFLTAANAAELSTALTQVAVAPEPVMGRTQFLARAGAGGPVVEDVAWSLTPTSVDGGALTFTGTQTATLEVGDYEVSAVWQTTGERVARSFTVVPEGSTVEVVFEPLPELSTVTFRAVIGNERGELIDTPVFWDVASETAAITDGEIGNPLTLELETGSHTVTAYWAEQEATSQARQFIVTADPREIIVVFEPPAITASIGAPSTAVLGSTIEVAWDGPGNAGDFIGIGAAGASGSGQWRNFANVEDGTPLKLLVPPMEGPHLISYFDAATRQPLGSAVIEVLAAPVSIIAPSEVAVSETFEVAWTGPNYEGDYLGIGKVGASGSGRWENFAYTADGSPAALLAPGEPGDYLLQYFVAQDRTPIAEVAVVVREPEVSLAAPTTAKIDETIEVAWTGPNTDGDYIGIGRVGASGSARWENFAYTADGSPAQLRMPATSGDYLITYFLAQDRTPLTQIAITVEDVPVSLTAPATAKIDETIEVAWTGPNTDGDYIGIGRVGASGSGKWENFAYTADGSPAQLRMPATSGDYLITYFLAQDRTPLTQIAITVEDVPVSLTAPATAKIDETIEVVWTGPNTDGDYIGIGRVGASGSARWDNFAYTADGSPAQLRMPSRPGDYLIQYFLAQDRTPLTQVAITVEPVPVSLEAPARAIAGETIEVAWTGPNTEGDYIGVGRVGSSGSARWEGFTSTLEGSPLQLRLPPTGGEYLIQYFLAQDRTPLTSVAITLDPVEATVSPPPTTIGGDFIDVPWTGPNREGDFIGIGPVGASGSSRYQRFASTADGAPARIKVPTLGGDYLVQYFLGQGRTPAAQAAMTVTTPAATIIAPSTVTPGATVEIVWTGPSYEGDFIGLGPIGASGSSRYRPRVAVAGRSTLTLTAPDAPGNYLIQYFVADGTTPIAQHALTVE